MMPRKIQMRFRRTLDQGAHGAASFLQGCCCFLPVTLSLSVPVCKMGMWWKVKEMGIKRQGQWLVPTGRGAGWTPGGSAFSRGEREAYSRLPAGGQAGPGQRDG